MALFEDIRAAKERITPYIAKTPLLRMRKLDEYLGCEVYVKAECMQITGSFKLRGALNRALSLNHDELSHGLVCSSSGNHGRAVAFVAKMLGTSATVVVPETATQVKVEAIKTLGAEVICCETSQRFAISEEISRKKGAILIPPFNDEFVMAGQGTIGIEIAQEHPELDAVVVPVSGGGLLGGVSCAVKSIAQKTKVYGTEPATLPRYSTSLAAGKITAVPKKKSLADALVCLSPGEKCFPVVSKYCDGVFAVEDKYMLKAMGTLLTVGKIFAEPSSCIGMGAVLQGLFPVSKNKKICFLISGGNAGLEQVYKLLNE